MEGWKIMAEHLYFDEHRTTQEVCDIIGVTRKYVSPHLRSCPRYGAERQRRKEEAAERAKECKRTYDQTKRRRPQKCTEDEKEMLRSDHIQAVKELSHEKYH